MYFVEDGTTRCGFYECQKCNNRFLDARVCPSLVCPNCGQEIDYEIGPDEDMASLEESAKLIEMIEGAENVERYDKLLSIAFDEDTSWLY